MICFTVCLPFSHDSVSSNSDENITHIHRRHTSVDLNRKAFTPEARRSLVQQSTPHPIPRLNLDSSTSSPNRSPPLRGGRKEEEEDTKKTNDAVNKDEEKENRVNSQEDDDEEGGLVFAAKEAIEKEDSQKSLQQLSTSTLLPNESDTSPTPPPPDQPMHVTGMRSMSLKFREALLSTLTLTSNSRIGLEVAKLADPHLDPVQVFARCLPHVVPNVILAKREVSTDHAY